MAVDRELLDDTLSRLEQLIEKHAVLQQEIGLLREALNAQASENKKLKEELQRVEEHGQRQQRANALVGGNPGDEQTKRWISELVQEIDTCIKELNR